MADGDIDVTYQDMHDAADHLLEAKDEILAKLQTLRTYIQDLVRDGYVTSASSIAFDQSYDEFNTGAREAVEALPGMADFLDGAADGYADLDRQLEEGLRE